MVTRLRKNERGVALLAVLLGMALMTLVVVDFAMTSGLGFVEAANQAAFDLILMDVQMPVMDGVEATRTIRRLAAPVGDTPIIAMTANVFTHQQQSYREAGMTGAVSKPLSPARLLAEINRIAGRRDAEDDASAAVA